MKQLDVDQPQFYAVSMPRSRNRNWLDAALYLLMVIAVSSLSTWLAHTLMASGPFRLH